MTLSPEDVAPELVALFVGFFDDAPFGGSQLDPDQFPAAAKRVADHREALARDVLAAVLPSAYRLLAERVALVSDIKVGFRCPACHGKPSSRKGGEYRCGCGYAWNVHDVHYSKREVNIPALLQQVAETGELPALPEKIARDGVQ